MELFLSSTQAFIGLLASNHPKKKNKKKESPVLEPDHLMASTENL